MVAPRFVSDFEIASGDFEVNHCGVAFRARSGMAQLVDEVPADSLCGDEAKGHTFGVILRDDNLSGFWFGPIESRNEIERTITSSHMQGMSTVEFAQQRSSRLMSALDRYQLTVEQRTDSIAVFADVTDLSVEPEPWVEARASTLKWTR